MANPIRNLSALCRQWGAVLGLRRAKEIPISPMHASPEVSQRLQAHVHTLAVETGPRNTDHPDALEAAARYVEGQFQQMGYTPVPQPYSAGGQSVRNIGVELPGSSRPEEILVIGAHYDSVDDSPGANDNGSGVASLLELARSFAGRPQPRTLRFIAFVNEEPPWFLGPQMGSQVYAQAARLRGDRIIGMLALETIGYYSDAPGSQQYPIPLPGYPNQGNFLGLVGHLPAAAWLEEVYEAFRRHCDFPAERLSAPAGLVGINWSDHASFWDAGYPNAIMVTDTAPFRYPYYHTRQDTPDKIDFGKLAQVTEGLSAAVANLASCATR